jgi:thiamine-phosphate pyrophosphorylase
MKRKIDWSLYLVTDRKLSRGRSLIEVVDEAVRGGVTAVQLREKECPDDEFIELAKEIRNILKGRPVPLLINDRIGVALAAGADGVHIGQSDTPYDEARERLGPDALIGLSVETMEQAVAAENLDVDYLGVGPIYTTATKTDTEPPWGTAKLRVVRARSRHTLVAIGGITAGNAGEVIRAGADGIAVVSAVCSKDSVRGAAAELRDTIDRAHAAVRPQRKNMNRGESL